MSPDPSKLWLNKLKPAHQAALKRLQPFETGEDWLNRLNDLANTDKHREINWVAIGPNGIRVKTNSSTAANTITDASRPTVDMNFEFTRAVALKDGTLVVETLEHLARRVRDVIDAFDPEF